MVDKQSKRIICTAFCNGKRHDFRLFKESKTYIHPETYIQAGTGYQGLQKLHAKTNLPKKRNRKNPLIKEDKTNNRKLASERALNENVIGVLKRLKLLLIAIEIDVSDSPCASI